LPAPTSARTDLGNRLFALLHRWFARASVASGHAYGCLVALRASTLVSV